MSDFDPLAPLPGPPDPWAEGPTPSLRPGPPFHMTDMIAAEPALAGRVLARLADGGDDAAQLAAAIRSTIEAGDPVVVTGCGTSEHGALATAEILREARDRGGTSLARHPRGAGLRAVARAARPRPRHRRHPRGRHRRDARRPPGRRRRRLPDRGHHHQPPVAGGFARRRSPSRPASSTRAGATRSAT